MVIGVLRANHKALRAAGGSSGRHGRMCAGKRPAFPPTARVGDWWPLGALLGALLLASACATPIGAAPGDRQSVYRALTSNVLSSGELSAPTQQVLLRLGLGERFDEEPEAVLSELRGSGSDLSRDQLSALAELSFTYADKSQKPEYYLAAAVYAYAFLLPADKAQAPRPVDPRNRLAAALYNLGLTLGLKTPEGERVVLEAGTRPLPFGTLELPLQGMAPDALARAPLALKPRAAASASIGRARRRWNEREYALRSPRPARRVQCPFRLTDPPREGGHKRARHVRTRVKTAAKSRRRDDEKPQRALRHHRGGARLAVEQAHLSEEIAGAKAQPLPRGDVDAGGALDDERPPRPDHPRGSGIVPAGASKTSAMRATARSCRCVHASKRGTASSRSIFSSWLMPAADGTGSSASRSSYEIVPSIIRPTSSIGESLPDSLPSRRPANIGVDTSNRFRHNPAGTHRMRRVLPQSGRIDAEDGCRRTGASQWLCSAISRGPRTTTAWCPPRGSTLRGPAADDATVAQPGEERPNHRAEAAAVEQLQRERGLPRGHRRSRTHSSSGRQGAGRGPALLVSGERVLLRAWPSTSPT